MPELASAIRVKVTVHFNLTPPDNFPVESIVQSLILERKLGWHNAPQGITAQAEQRSLDAEVDTFVKKMEAIAREFLFVHAATLPGWTVSNAYYAVHDMRGKPIAHFNTRNFVIAKT